MFRSLLLLMLFVGSVNSDECRDGGRFSYVDYITCIGEDEVNKVGTFLVTKHYKFKSFDNLYLTTVAQQTNSFYLKDLSMMTYLVNMSFDFSVSLRYEF